MLILNILKFKSDKVGLPSFNLLPATSAYADIFPSRSWPGEKKEILPGLLFKRYA